MRAGELARRVASPSTSGRHWSRRRASCCCALTEPGVRLGQHAHAEQRHEQRGDHRAERGARHRDAGRARQVQRAVLGARAVPSAPPLDDDDERARRRRARPAPSTRLLGVARVRDREDERARPDERGRAVLLQHDDRAPGAWRCPTATSTSPTIPEPPIPSTTMLSMSSARAASRRVDARRGLVRGGELLGQPRTASRTPSESTLTAAVRPRTSGGCRRPRPWRPAARARRRRPSRPRRSA